MPISVQPASNPTLPGLDDCIDDDARRTSYDQVFAALRARCPDHIEYDRWQHAIRDAATFLGTWGVQAHALGWTTADLFGLHPAPARLAAKFSRLSRRDALGLIWLLDGRPVIALTHQQAEIQGAGGVLIYRKLGQPAVDSGVGLHSMRGDDDSARGDHLTAFSRNRTSEAPRAILAHLREGRPMYDRHDLRWDGNRLRLRSGRLLATLVADADWDGLWRVRMPDGYVSDMVNLTRAKDAAQLLALASLNASAPGRAA